MKTPTSADPALQRHFSALTNEALLDCVLAGLTPEAHAIACDELRRRGISPPLVDDREPAEPPPYAGDMVILARDLKPTEAHLLASCLAAAGIHAAAGDTHTVQANSLWSLALGGANVRVAQSQLADAQEVWRALRRGRLALPDDVDVGPAPQEDAPS